MMTGVDNSAEGRSSQRAPSLHYSGAWFSNSGAYLTSLWEKKACGRAMWLAGTAHVRGPGGVGSVFPWDSSLACLLNSTFSRVEAGHGKEDTGRNGVAHVLDNNAWCFFILFFHFIIIIYCSF